MVIYDVVGDIVSEIPESVIKTSTEQKVYTDEVIRRDNAIITPDKYRQMRRLAQGSMSKAEIFVAQAEFMADFEDDLEYKGQFVCYYPTYEDMTTQQLRGYFTWRTHFRKGQVKPAPTSFIFVYIYEIINNVGVKNPKDGITKLWQVFHQYRADATVKRYLEAWICDYAVCQDLEYPIVSLTDTHAVLLDYKNHPKQAVFKAITKASTYNIEKSRIYAKHPDITFNAVYNVYCLMSEHYTKLGVSNLFMRLFGSQTNSLYQMFAGAVYLKRPHSDCQYTVSPTKSFTCKDGVWYCSHIYSSKSGERRMGEILRSVDNLLRKTLGVTPLLKNAEVSTVRTEIINKAIRLAVQQISKEKQIQAAKSIRLDLNSLDKIRQSADIIMERLTVLEDESGFEEVAKQGINAYMNNKEYDKIKDTITTDVSAIDTLTQEQTLTAEALTGHPLDVKANGQGELLTDTEKEFLKLVLTGGDYRELLKARRIMPQVMVESINQKLYDIFADTVLEGDEPVAVEDYVPDLKGMLGL